MTDAAGSNIHSIQEEDHMAGWYGKHFHPTILLHGFLSIIHFDRLVLIDMLLGDDTGCLEYLTRYLEPLAFMSQHLLFYKRFLKFFAQDTVSADQSIFDCLRELQEEIQKMEE